MSSSTPARGRPGLTLVAVCFGLFMVGLDATVVHIANPAISADLGTSFGELQWITNSYLLALAAFLILGGKLGDRFGRRRLYLIGIVAFGISSVAIGLAGTAEGAIAFRAVQGLCAALLMPQTLALLRATFPREKFGMAVGIWGGVSSVAIAAGPIIGGLVVDHIAWEWVFYINAPIAVIGVVFGALVLRESTADVRGGFDLLGVVLLAASLIAVVFGVVQSGPWGWGDPRTIGCLGGGLALLAVFVWVESRVASPLLPLSLFRSRGVSVGSIAVAANFFAMLGVTFILTLFLLNTRGVGAVEAGVMLLPMSGVSIIASPIGALMVARWGTRVTATTGLTLVAGALLALTQITADSAYVAMAVPFVFFALGAGMTMTAGAEAIVGSAPMHLAGVAGGFQATSLQVGGALGTAVLAAVVSAKVASGTEGLGLDAEAKELLAQGLVVPGLPADVAAAAQDAFLSGLHGALLTAAVVAAVAAVLANVFLRPRRTVTYSTVIEELVEAEAGHL